MMKMRALAQGFGVVTALWLVGCGGEPAPASSAAGAGGSAAGGGGQAGQGGSGSGGLAGGGSGQGGAKPLDCSGAFGTPSPSMPEEVGVRLASPTLSPDTLELIYARETGELAEFRRSARGSVDETFPLGVPLPALDAACMPGELRSADFSGDGLRVYVACYSATAIPTGPATLHVAERATLTAPFTLRPGTQSVGPSPAVSVDELTLVSTSMIERSGYPPRQFKRASVDALFDAGAEISGLETVNITAPEPSPDQLSIYGGLDGKLVVAVRASPDGAFAAPTSLYEVPVAQPGPIEVLGAPEVSRDCRTLLYLHQTTVEAVTTTKLMMARR